MASSIQPQITACPKCSSTDVSRDGIAVFDSSNAFMVRREGGYITFSIPGDVNGRKFRLDSSLPAETSLNLAAWLANIADPSGVEFARLFNEVRTL